MAVDHAELVVDGGEVVAQGAFADVQGVCDGFAGFANVAGDGGHNLLFALGEVGGFVCAALVGGFGTLAGEFDKDATCGVAVEPDLTFVDFLQRVEQGFGGGVPVDQAVRASHDGLVFLGVVVHAGEQQDVGLGAGVQLGDQRGQRAGVAVDVKKHHVNRCLGDPFTGPRYGVRHAD